jgi:hypothetical protein
MIDAVTFRTSVFYCCIRLCGPNWNGNVGVSVATTKEECAAYIYIALRALTHRGVE